MLPSSAENPANMIAQALAVYKSVVSGVSTDGSHVNISHELSRSTKDAPSGETESEILNPRAVEARDTSHVGQAEFSLQDSKKKE